MGGALLDEVCGFGCRQGERVLCKVSLRILVSSPSHGRVSAEIFFGEPFRKGTQSRWAQSQSWFEKGDDLIMCVQRFSVPDALKRRGVGSRIWSEFYRRLPTSIRERMILKGKLSSTDARVVKTDESGFTVSNHEGPILINQIAIRNRFWTRMLAEESPGQRVLWCDEEGNGAFRGRFRDPLD